MKVVKIDNLGFFKQLPPQGRACSTCHFTLGGKYCLKFSCDLSAPYAPSTEEEYLLAKLRGEAYDTQSDDSEEQHGLRQD